MIEALRRRVLRTFRGLARWLAELRADIMENPARFRLTTGDGQSAVPALEPPERRYAVNLLVDHGDETGAVIVLESNPTYENLFGRIEYRQAQGSVETDFTLIRAGALHRANGGILVLRAEALAANPASWSFLKAALRDREIRIEELARAQMTPIAGAPQPQPIPLDLKVVIVGAPRWYSLFFERRSRLLRLFQDQGRHRQRHGGDAAQSRDLCRPDRATWRGAAASTARATARRGASSASPRAGPSGATA